MGVKKEAVRGPPQGAGEGREWVTGRAGIYVSRASGVVRLGAPAAKRQEATTQEEREAGSFPGLLPCASRKGPSGWGQRDGEPPVIRGLIECGPSKGISRGGHKANLPDLLSLCKHSPIPECRFHWIQEVFWLGKENIWAISQKKAQCGLGA